LARESEIDELVLAEQVGESQVLFRSLLVRVLVMVLATPLAKPY
jgi:hypothetical protein